MIRPAMIALAFVGAAPALATPPDRHEVTIPRMSHYLEWRAESPTSLFIRADTGRWYRVRTEAPCPRLMQQPRIRFIASAGDRFDRYSSIRADSWRCQVASISESGTPPHAPHAHLSQRR
jgi:hypothetical protein